MATWLVTAETLNLRATPEVKEGNILASLPLGTLVNTASSQPGAWAAITVDVSGRTLSGHVSARYLTPCRTPPERYPDELEAALPERVLIAIMPRLSVAKRAEYLPHLRQAMLEHHIDNPARKAAFLAQLAHESAQLRYMEEIASGAAYEGRRDLGNTQPGDGVRYKGRGPIQLTGRSNYRTYGSLLGVDLENNPALAATAQVGFRTAGLYWMKNGLNELADVPGNFKLITKKINGGYNGLEDRFKYYTSAKAALGVPASFSTRAIGLDAEHEPAADDPRLIHALPRGAEVLEPAAAPELMAEES
jgi:predicted chitinase